MSGQPAFEPTADARVAARQWRNLYQALIAENFSEHQALALLGQVITAAIASGGSGK